jgi:hypothetical protein
VRNKYAPDPEIAAPCSFSSKQASCSESLKLAFSSAESWRDEEYFLLTPNMDSASLS